MSDTRCSKPVRGPDEPALFIGELIAELPADARVLDAGCGPGSWEYAHRADLRIAAFDIKFPPGPPAPAPRVSVARADLARLPYRDQSFDLTLCHYVLEHVTELEACCDSLARVTREGGTVYLSVPRAAAFDDRLYRFAGYFAKYALGKFRKRIEHQQRFDLDGLLAMFRRRGLHAMALARVPAGFSWMNDARTKRLQGPFTDAVAWLHRSSGIDLAADANFVLTFRKGTDARAPDEPPIVRRVTHVCRECGELSVCAPPAPAPHSWTCPWCGKPNPFGRAR